MGFKKRPALRMGQLIKSPIMKYSNINNQLVASGVGLNQKD